MSDTLDSCYEEEIDEGGGGGDDGTGPGGPPGGDGDDVDPVVVESDPTTDSSGTTTTGEERVDFRPVESSSNFMTEDKTIKSTTSALARRKYMIRSPHFINQQRLIEYKSEVKGPEWLGSAGELFRKNSGQFRWPYDSIRFQDEYVPPTGNRDFEYMDSVDPLMFCLGGYYTQTAGSLSYSRDGGYFNPQTVERASPSNKRPAGFRTIAPTLMLRHPSGYEKDAFPFMITIEKLTEAAEAEILERSPGRGGDTDLGTPRLFLGPGVREYITFNFKGNLYFDVRGTSSPAFGRSYSLGLQRLYMYLFPYSVNEFSDLRQGDAKTDLVSTTSWEHYDFVTDMPFFAREVEKIDNMKNLTVSINLESNFVSTAYRNYGNSIAESENFLPSVYFLNTMERIKTLSDEEREDYLEKVSPGDDPNSFQKKMLFTSEDVEQFPSINDEFKRKVPMYVEFNIGTNQGSPLAEILRKTDLDKSFLEYVSERNFERNAPPANESEYGRMNFAEIIEGVADNSDPTVVDSFGNSGVRRLFTTEQTRDADNRTAVFNFEDWSSLFSTERDSDRYHPFLKEAVRDAEGNILTEEELQIKDSNRIQGLSNDFFMALQNLLDNPPTNVGLVHNAIVDIRTNVRNSSAFTSGATDDVMRYVKNEIQSDPNTKKYFFGLPGRGEANNVSANQQAFTDSYNRLNAAARKAGLSGRGRLGRQRELLGILEGWKESRLEILNKTLEGINVKNFPLKINDDLSEFNQFKMIMQSIILKGKLDTKYRPLFRTYGEIVAGDSGDEYAYSETVMYRVDKHRVSIDGEVEPTPIQSFFMMDSDGVENINFVDSQVIFGQRYIYRIYSYDFVVGTEYEYNTFYNQPRSFFGRHVVFTGDEPRGQTGVFFGGEGAWSSEEDGPEPGDAHRGFRLMVRSNPIYKIVEVPYLEREIIVMDRPPMFPEVKVYPVNDSKTTFKISLQATSGERKMDPIAIEPEDNALISDIRKVQGLGETDPVFYESDDLPTTYQVYRTESPPLTYSAFAGKMHYTIAQENASAVDFYEYVEPNKKYYYTFRCLDKSVNISNPSIVYQIEIVSKDGYSYLDVNPYNFPKAERHFKTTFKEALYIRAADIQKVFNINENNLRFGILRSEEQRQDFGDFGDFDRSIFDKGRRFKIRIKSKHSQKKIDLNVSFVQNRTTQQELVISVPNSEEIERQQRVPQNMEFQRIHSLYGQDYSDFMNQITDKIVENSGPSKDGETDERPMINRRPPPQGEPRDRPRPTMTPSPSSSPGGSGGSSGGGSSGGGGGGSY